jgi:hypothetical protein
MKISENVEKSPTTIRIKMQSLLRLKTVNVAKTHKSPTMIILSNLKLKNEHLL